MSMFEQRQEIFNIVAAHLMKQGKRSEMGFFAKICMYKFNGLKCAVGVLIKDEFYDELMERKSVHSPLVREALRKSGWDIGHGDIGEGDIEFLSRLQHIHDSVAVEEWSEGLSLFAYNYRLNDYVLRATPVPA